MVGGLKKIVYAQNRQAQVKAIVLSQGGLFGNGFGTTFTFNHDEFPLWQTAPRQLKVRLDAMLVYDDKRPNSLDKPVAVSPESIGGEYSCTFEVQSRSSGNKVRVKLPKRGIYALAAIETYSFESLKSAFVVVEPNRHRFSRSQTLFGNAFFAAKRHPPFQLATKEFQT